MPDPLYTAENCKFAYQLNWSVSIFARQAIPAQSEWLANLKDNVEPDGVRILECRTVDETSTQFLISTKPEVSPSKTIQSLKGRLQYAIREHIPKAFRRNYFIGSVGSVKREAVETYIQSQTEHHTMADVRVQRRLDELQIENPDIDLSTVRRSSHGEFVHNLHLVFVHAERWNEIREPRLQALYGMIRRASSSKGHSLSRAGILADHVHMALGCAVDESPRDVALGYMNNLAFAQGMTRIYQYGCYVGTFGKYDLGAIRHALAV